MGRTRKSQLQHDINRHIGERVTSAREQRRISPSALAELLGITPSHLRALEAGKYAFSADLLYAVAATLACPVSFFFPGAPVGSRLEGFQEIMDRLSARDQEAFLEIGRKLANWPDDLRLSILRRTTSWDGRLVSLEGVDGVVLEELSQQLVARLNEQGADRCLPCGYRFEEDIWKFMLSDPAPGNGTPEGALIRTLVFACERLHRQEAFIRPALALGKTVVTPFFTLAPKAYQLMEGLTDPTIVETVAHFLLEPDVIVYVDSDPVRAQRRATRMLPGPGQFYSPYFRLEDFVIAREIHLKMIEDRTRLQRRHGADLIQVDGRQPFDVILETLLAALQAGVDAKGP